MAPWSGLGEDRPTLVGIDHGFSFSLRYFETHRLLPDWPAFLDYFQRHWPTDEDHVDFVRDGVYGNGAARMGNARWRAPTATAHLRQCSTRNSHHWNGRPLKLGMDLGRA